MYKNLNMKKRSSYEEHPYSRSVESGENNDLNVDVGLLSKKMLDLTFQSIQENKTVSWK